MLGPVHPVLEVPTGAWELILLHCTLKWDLGTVGDPLQHDRGEEPHRWRIMVGGLGDEQRRGHKGGTGDTEGAEDMEGRQRRQQG